MKKMMKNMSRNVALGMAALTLVSTCMGTAVKVHAADPGDVGEMPQANIVDNSTGTDMGKAVIKGGIGAIPVVGEFAAEVLDPLIGELFGVIFDEKDPNDAILDKLAEIQDQLKNLDAKIDQETQKELLSQYKHGFDKINENMTAVSQIEADLFDAIRSKEADTNLTPLERNLEIGALLETRSTDTAQFVNKLRLVAAYVAGTQSDIELPEPLYQMVYKANCQGSKLGGEAALKTADYINKVNTILENGFKLETMVLEAKMVATNQLNAMDGQERQEEYESLMKHYTGNSVVQMLLNMCKTSADKTDKQNDSIMGDWKTAVGIPDGKGGYTGAKGFYESICNPENPNSVAGKYNTMVNEVWFDYIKKVESTGTRVNVAYLKLDDDMKATDYKDLGINQDYTNMNDSKTYESYSDKIRSFAKIETNDTGTVITPKEVQDAVIGLKKLPEYEGENIYNVLKEYGFKIEDAVKTNSDRYGISSTDVESVSEEKLLKAANPIFVISTDHRDYTMGATVTMNGTDLAEEKEIQVPVCHVRLIEILSDHTYRRMLGFKTITANDTVDEATFTSNVDFDELVAQIEAGFRNNGDTSIIGKTANENTENADADNTDDSIVLTVDENGQITGDQMNDAWTVAEDGTIILNKDNKFRFEGTVADKNIQNNGEIVDGNFKNVKLELVDNAVITKGTFEDCEITTNENAVIGEEVEFINTTIIDAKDIGNEEEEEQKEEQKDNPQDVVEETPVVENDMF